MKPISAILPKIVDGLITKDCIDCGQPFDVEDRPISMYINCCQSCQEKKDQLENEQHAQDARRDIERRSEKWAELCPPEYLHLEKTKLPKPQLLEEVMAWRYGPKGLILHGDSGTGKTRCAWALLHREYSNGNSIKTLDSMAGIRYAARFSESGESVEKWIEQMIAAKILLMDDIFKVKLTDSFEGAIFSLVDQRIQFQKPTIVTTNDTGNSLEVRLSVDRAKPLLRRLREHCRQINF